MKPEKDQVDERVGISNRETPQQEARERKEHPPEHTRSPEAEDAESREP